MARTKNTKKLDPNKCDDRLEIEATKMMNQVFGGPIYRTPAGELDLRTWPCMIWEPNRVPSRVQKGIYVFLRFPDDYPQSAPQVRLSNSFHNHPHVDKETFRVKSDILTGGKWNPEMTAQEVLVHVRAVLGHKCPKKGDCDI